MPLSAIGRMDLYTGRRTEHLMKAVKKRDNPYEYYGYPTLRCTMLPLSNELVPIESRETNPISKLLAY